MKKMPAAARKGRTDVREVAGEVLVAVPSAASPT